MNDNIITINTDDNMVDCTQNDAAMNIKVTDVLILDQILSDYIKEMQDNGNFVTAEQVYKVKFAWELKERMNDFINNK